MNDAERLEDMICDLRRENAELLHQVEQLVSAWKDAQEKIADLTHKIECMTEEQGDLSISNLKKDEKTCSKCLGLKSIQYVTLDGVFGEIPCLFCNEKVAAQAYETEEQFDPMRDGWVGKDGKP